jgi:leucyl/phenylalanyl-tRNA--protein transferase
MIEPFPPTENALTDPNGLLAVGGDLSAERLLHAYQRGIFPWYEDGEPILWWAPNPRAVLFPSQLHVSRSLQKFLNKSSWTISVNRCFQEVVAACAELTEQRSATWISSDIALAYTNLHRMGYAQSVEVFDGEELVGGLYGVTLGRIFFGESMFSRQTNASKVALHSLCSKVHFPDLALIDCQMPNPHLESLGMSLIPRVEFEQLLEKYL